ncbi:MAG: 4Fe-4S dicluster domain-containing protein [Bacteroidota bacterium]
MSNTVTPNSDGTQFWKSWEDAVETHQAPETDRQEFEGIDQPTNGLSRRSFMALMSASAALAATGCRRPDHKLVPSVKAVEYQIPGLPNYYTSVYQRGNAALGVVVKTREGRPIKVDGNDMHPATGSASSPDMQASLLSLYDPDRMRQTRVNNGASTPQNALRQIAQAIKETQAQGKVTRILIDEHCSPSLAALTREVEAANPSVRFVMSGNGNDNAAIANQAAYGINGQIVPDLSKADVIISIEADFLGADAYSVLHNRNFAAKRRPSVQNAVMNRLIAAESIFTLTGANADTRIRLNAGQHEEFLSALSNALGGGGASSNSFGNKINQIAQEIKSGGGNAVVLVGGHLPARIHTMAASLNSSLGAVGAGKALNSANVLPNSGAKGPGMQAFANELRNKQVGVVIFAGGNPEYSGSKEVKNLLKEVPFKFALSMYEDESSTTASISIPTTHYLESWGDAVTFDGTVSIQQPMISPMNEGSMSLGDALLQLSKNLGGNATAGTYFDYVQRRYGFGGGNAAAASTATDSAATTGVNEVIVSPEQNARWEQMLRDGVFKSPEFAAAGIAFNAAGASAAQTEAPMDAQGKILCVITPSYKFLNSYLSNNGWLQELPDPVTKVTWDNVASMSKATAEKLGVTFEDVIELKTNEGSINLPVFIQPGMGDNVIHTTTGYGRREGGQVLKNIGANALELLKEGQSIGYIPVDVRKTGERHKIATTQKHFDLHGRDIVHEASLDEMKTGKFKLHSVLNDELSEGQNPNSKFVIPLSINNNYEYKGHKWGMMVDLSACTGCSACTVACQAENNIPVVGKEQVLLGREMHWIRIDRYYGAKSAEQLAENPDVYHQPMLCQHCENAPCENVCPVAATTHSPEGLNEMTYNRCVGTRYCNNNCPYKVRRFNYLKYHKNDKSPLEFVFNPDVTVRGRGVIEKCTFCVQRINEGKYNAKDEGRTRVKDGEIITACQQACPAGAIVFGDINDPTSQVAKFRNDDRSYLVLEELNTRPSVSYLAKVRNRTESVA